MSKAQTAMQIHLEKLRNLVDEDIIPEAHLQSLEDIKEEVEIHGYRLEQAYASMTTKEKKKPDSMTIEDMINSTPLDEIKISDLHGDLFQPAPDHWKQIINLPPHLKKVWSKSFLEEWKLHLKM